MGKPTTAGNAKQRTRSTNKSEEAKRFSTVKPPKSSEITHSTSSIHQEGASFDPIPNDQMFLIVEQSKYWPPPPLSQLPPLPRSGAQAEGEVTVATLADGMDMFDRRADDRAQMTARVKRMAGEVNHPRRKAPKNLKVNFSAEASDED